MISAKVALIIPRLATEHVGELVATRDALIRSLRSEGLDLHDLAAACIAAPAQRKSPAPVTEPAPHGRAPCFGDQARACRDLDRGQLSSKERTFVADMVRRGFAFRPSPRQADWLADILSRLKGRAAA